MMNIYELALLYYKEAYYLHRQVFEESDDDTTRRLGREGMANAKESLGFLEFQLKLPLGPEDLRDARELYRELGRNDKVETISQTLQDKQGGH